MATYETHNLALVSAPQPKTVKQKRSFLGSYKQLNPSLPKYAETVYALEKTVADRKSAEPIKWTDALQERSLPQKN